MSFRAILATRADDGAISASLQTLDNSVLSDGGVTVAVDWSTLNYKDAVALAGPQIIQTFPLVPGIDFAGTVVDSDDTRFSPGDKVVATGWGLSHTHHGGYAQRARVSGNWLVHSRRAHPTVSLRRMLRSPSGRPGPIFRVAGHLHGLPPARARWPVQDRYPG